MRCPTLSELPSPSKGKTGWPWTVESPQLPETMPDGKPWPRISIVTPSYNQGQFIEETIRSVLLQGYPNLEYIIIDGGSSDESVDIIKKYSPWLKHWVSEPDRGQVHAINKGFTRSSGDILNWLNSDDLFLPITLHQVIWFWRDHDECCFLTGDAEIVDCSISQREFYIRGDSYSFDELLNFHKGYYLPQPAVFFSQKAYFSVGGVNLSLNYAMDTDLWLRLRLKYRLWYLPELLAQMRHHDEAKTWRQNLLAMKEVRQVIKQYIGFSDCMDRPWVLLGLRRLVADSYLRQCRGYIKSGQIVLAVFDIFEALRMDITIILSKQYWRSIKNMLLH